MAGDDADGRSIQAGSRDRFVRPGRHAIPDGGAIAWSHRRQTERGNGVQEEGTMMRRLAGALFILASLVLAAAPATAARDRACHDLSAETVRRQITYLASDELRGRESGEPGNEKAARFVADAFRRAGLKPIGTAAQRDPAAPMDGSGYFQPFRFIAGRTVGHANRLQANLGGAWRSYQPGHDFEPSTVSGAGAAAGTLVFAGFGIRAPSAGHDDYAGLDVKGRVVLLLAGNPKDDPHSPLSEYAGIRRKALSARELGAAAVLVAPGANSDAQATAPADFSDASDSGLPVLRVKRDVAAAWLQDR